MKINKNDPQLTAYVLNELSPQQMKALETQIQSDPELKAEVNRIKSNMTQFKTLKTKEVFRLDPHQRENIFKTAGISQTFTWSKILKYSGGLVAASLAVIIYTNNSGKLNRSAKMSSDMQASAPALDEMSDSASAKVVARAESRPMAAKKIMNAQQEGEKTDLDLSRGAPPPPVDMAASELLAAEDASTPDLASALRSDEAPPPKAKMQASKARTGSFSAGEVGAADMSAKKMGLLNAFQGASKKDTTASEEALGAAPAGLAMKEVFGSAGAGASPSARVQPPISKQLYDLESKSSQPEVYAKIAGPIFKCFDSSLSQYVKYDVAWNLTWSAKLGNVTAFSSEIIDSGTESLKNPRQDFTNEIACVEQAIRTAFKKSLPPSQNETVFKYRFILKSK